MSNLRACARRWMQPGALALIEPPPVRKPRILRGRRTVLGKLHGWEDFIRARWEAGLSDRQISDDLLTEHGVDVTYVSIWKHRMVRGMDSRGLRPGRPRALTSNQHVRLLRQFHEERTSLSDLAEYWKMSEVSIWNYVRNFECDHPDAAKIKRRKKRPYYGGRIAA